MAQEWRGNNFRSSVQKGTGTEVVGRKDMVSTRGWVRSPACAPIQERLTGMGLRLVGIGFCGLRYARSRHRILRLAGKEKPRGDAGFGDSVNEAGQATARFPYGTRDAAREGAR